MDLHIVRKVVVRLFAFAIALGSVALASDLSRAREVYNRTEYKEALQILSDTKEVRDASSFELEGRCWYQVGDFKRAIAAFEKAAQMDPSNSSYANWLGRAWGRRAETSNPLVAAGYASKARNYFEKAVQLNPKDKQAVNDLFTYYLEAPGILGGGIEKASELAERSKANGQAEYYLALAQVAERKRLYDVAESQLHRAIEVAPRHIGALVDMAKFLARRGKIEDSDKLLAQASKIAPTDKGVLFARAECYVAAGTHLKEAKQLLEQYIEQPLTPNDPPRDDALRLYKRIGGE